MINNLDQNTQGGIVAFVTALLVFTLLLAIGSGEKALKMWVAGVGILLMIMLGMMLYRKMIGSDEINDEEIQVDSAWENPEEPIIEALLKKEDQAPLGSKPKKHPPRYACAEPLRTNSKKSPEQEKRSQLIEQTLSEFGVPAKVVSVKQGPRLTQYGIEPGFTEKKERGGTVKRRKIKVNTIYGLEDDLALALAVKTVRLARVPGQSYIGLETPNDKSEIVPLAQILASAGGALPIALGADVTGQPVTADITKMPHALIAGATNSGKSICIHTIVASLLSLGPEKVRLLLVDPKMVELVQYNGIPHLLEPVITDMEKTVVALEKQVQEMERRLELFSQVGKRNLESYNKWAVENDHDELPYRVIILDELADLMMVHKEEVEPKLVRLAQMARATGIHVFLATQRPTVDVVTGLIKANVPTRISFAVAESIDSRVILDANGAEGLLGRGDALYLASDASEPVRMQGCFISDEELEALIGHWQAKPGASLPDLPAETGETNLNEHEKAEISDEPNTENNINDEQVESLTWNEVWPIVIELFNQTTQMERVNMKTTKDAARSLGASIGREVWQGGAWRDITAAFTVYAQAQQKEGPQKEV
ncbi:MAG: DNA translocase FtsK [Ardenticatenaceae bacterium]